MEYLYNADDTYEFSKIYAEAGWQIELCSADDRPAVDDFLERTMYVEEPIMSTLDVSLMEDAKNHTKHLDIVLEGHSFKAVTPSGIMVGVVLNKSCPYKIEEYEPVPKVSSILRHIAILAVVGFILRKRHNGIYLKKILCVFRGVCSAPQVILGLSTF